MPPSGPVVGFDLDMTLIDTRPGFAACLRALGEEAGIDFDVEAMVEALGPPLDLMLEPYAEPDRIPALVDRFRAMYPQLAVAPTLALPGTHEAIAAVRARGGKVVVVTGKFTPNALLHTEALAFDVDHVAGEVWGVGKSTVLREHGCSVYVGDHVHDVEGALAAGATSVSVLTGGCTEAELRAAGTHHVLRDLTEFPDWWSAHATGSTGSPAGP
jgi:phosphoglycolate phosphatase-like HAD superfamily hydrolase